MFQIVMVIIVGLALFQYVNNVATDLGFDKKYNSLDIGLLTTVAYYTPGTLIRVYIPIRFPVQMNFIFENATIDTKEKGKELDAYAWFLFNRNMEPLKESIPIEASDIQVESSANFIQSIQQVLQQILNRPNMTYYKTGRQLSFDKSAVNPLQMDCPVINTSADTASRSVYLLKVLKSKADYTKSDLPVNRVAQIIQAKHPEVKTVQAGSSQGGSISAIPSDAKVVIVLGDSGDGREPGSLVAYFPVNNNTMKNRKLACFVVNDILTPKTTVYYAQLMPVYVDTIATDSPLAVFNEISAGQVIVFVDFSSYKTAQMNVEVLADMIYRGVDRYFGGDKIPQTMYASLSFTSSPDTSADATTAVSTASSSAAASAPSASSSATPSQGTPSQGDVCSDMSQKGMAGCP